MSAIKRMAIFAAAVMMTLIFVQPTAPVLAGMGLLLVVLISAGRGLASQSAARRRRFFNRACVLGFAAIALMLAGAHTPAPWNIQIESAVQARGAMFSLLLYCIALLAVPVAAWIHICEVMSSSPRVVCIRQAQAYVRSRDILRNRPTPALNRHYATCQRRAG